MLLEGLQRFPLKDDSGVGKSLLDGEVLLVEGDQIGIGYYQMDLHLSPSGLAEHLQAHDMSHLKHTGALACSTRPGDV